MARRDGQPALRPGGVAGGLAAELERLTAEQTRLQKAFDATNEESTAILARLEALDWLGDRKAAPGRGAPVLR